MALILWNDRFSVGVPSLDIQHRQLVEMVNELHAALAAGRGEPVIRELLDRLGRYAETHLESEEQMLRAHDYPDFAAHKAQHEEYLARVRELQSRAGHGQVAMVISLLAFFKDWWTSHILHADKAYSDYLRARRAA